MLFFAARAQLVYQNINSSINRNEFVICDRFCDSTLAYQGYGKKINLRLIKMCNEFVVNTLTPDLTILMNIDYETSLMRLNNKKDRMENNSKSFDNFTVSLFAGQEGSTGFDNGPRIQASFFDPYDITKDSNGNVFVSDTGNNAIRKIDIYGNVTTYTEGLIAPRGIVLDEYGNIFVAESGGHAIRKIDNQGNVTTFAGQRGIVGSADGNGIQAQFNRPHDLVFDKNGNIYVTDTFNHLIRKIDTNGNVTTIAGTGEAGSQDGISLNSSFCHPMGIVIDTKENLFIAENCNHTIRKITAEQNVTTFAGGTRGALDGFGTEARFNFPNGLSIDPNNNLYLAGNENHSIRKIDASGYVSTIAGVHGVSGTNNGNGNESLFKNPFGVFAESNGNIYVVDSRNNTIRLLEGIESNTSINDNHTYQEIFRGSTQHTVTEGTNSLNLRLAPLLDDRELTVPRIT